MYKWAWDEKDPQRYNPLDDATDENINIAILQSIESMRKFFTGTFGARRMSDEEFADLLVVARNSALSGD